MPPSFDRSLTRRLVAALSVFVASLAAVAAFAPSSARASDPATDSNCSTRPASVPAAYGCVVIYEPNGKSNGNYGEIYYQRDTSNVLHLLAFPTLKADDNVLLCARTAGPYTPSNSNQQDKCIGNTPTLIYQGSVADLGPSGGKSLDSVTKDLQATVYWVLHINQGGKTTVGLGAVAGSPSVAFSDDCRTGITATLDNSEGAGPAVFDLTINGVASKSSPVAPGATGTASAALLQSNDTATMTVSAPGLAPVTHSYDASKCGAGSPAAAPVANVAGDCDSHVIVTLDNSTGTAGATFDVNDGSTTASYPIAAGATTVLDLGAAGTRTVSVTAPNMTTASKQFSCPQTEPSSGGTQQPGGTTGGQAMGGQTGGGTTGPQHAIDPAVSFATACKTGITATFTNMKLDDTTMAPVTFKVTTPSGTTDSVTVAADQLVKRSYAVTEDTTGKVTVTAPGMAKQTKSYAKNCTSVLGEKVSKGTKKPIVQGEKAAKLPFTGAPTGQLALEACALLGAGAVLMYAGRRRYRGVHAKR